MMRRALIWLCLMLMLSCAGCGFHLRTEPILTQRFAKLYISTSAPYNNFTRELKSALHHDCVTIVDCPNQAPIGLYITNVKISYDPPTIGNSSTSRVFRYYLKLDFQLKSSTGKPIGDVQHVLASRFTTLNAGILTETNNQIYLVEKGLIDDAIRQIFYRVVHVNPNGHS